MLNFKMKKFYQILKADEILNSLRDTVDKDCFRRLVMPIWWPAAKNEMFLMDIAANLWARCPQWHLTSIFI